MLITNHQSQMNPYFVVIIRFFASIILWFMGFKVTGSLPPNLKKFVLLGAPHTANRDFIVALGWLRLPNIRPMFVGKESAVRRPRRATITRTFSHAQNAHRVQRRNHRRNRSVSCGRPGGPRLPAGDRAQPLHVRPTGTRLCLFHLRQSLVLQCRLPRAGSGRGGPHPGDPAGVGRRVDAREPSGEIATRTDQRPGEIMRGAGH